MDLFGRVVSKNLDAFDFSHRAFALEPPLDEEIPRQPLNAIGAGHLSAGPHRSRLHLSLEGPVANERAEFLVLRSWLGYLRLLGDENSGCDRDYGDDSCEALHRWLLSNRRTC